MLLAGSSQRAIARALGASPSTVSREVSRCKGAYDPRAAQLDAYNLSRRPKARKLDEDGVSVNIFFTISTNIFSPIAPPLFRRPRQRGCAASG